MVLKEAMDDRALGALWSTRDKEHKPKEGVCVFWQLVRSMIQISRSSFLFLSNFCVFAISLIVYLFLSFSQTSTQHENSQTHIHTAGY